MSRNPTPQTAPRRRPMARVRHVALFSREIRERLSLAGAELLLDRATRLTEGQLSGDGHYFGSTMLTIDLEQAYEQGMLREEPDVATALRLARLMSASAPVRRRVATMARQAAEQQAQGPLSHLELDVRMRAEGLMVFIDIDAEARSSPSAAGRARAERQHKTANQQSS